MIKPINFAKLTKSYVKIKNASNEALARTHYIKFLKEEDKFMKATNKLEKSIDDWSLKSPFDFCSAISHFVKMGNQKLKSVYYFKKM